MFENKKTYFMVWDKNGDYCSMFRSLKSAKKFYDSLSGKVNLDEMSGESITENDYVRTILTK